ncbi:hypothetical protein E2C01_088655 [Portunus trituberculatus]|uniref:Uncharacterized protein n=1 Tax=Portunus trituberculatus TaxID=210409 RepID=A0A5B7JGM0_PORTR|nr:hypothetical protein [Portunus trituberculatus]
MKEMCEIMNESFKKILQNLIGHCIAKDYRKSQCTKRILEEMQWGWMVY